jgi:outer membrane protein OmpA-like peptidoglycan-associated protein
MTSDDSRSRAEQLIAIADKVSQQPVPTPKSRKWVPAVVAILGVAAVGGGIFGLLSAGGSDSTTADTSVGTTLAPPITNAPTTQPVAVETTLAPDTTLAPTTTEAVTTTEAPTTTVELIVDPNNPIRWAEFTGGKVYLQGTVPDQATADEVRDKAAAVVGPDNVIVQYQIVPGAPRPESAPLFVRDSALFGPNSTAIDDTARGVLDLGVVLMTQNPAVTIDIHGYTDSDGDEAANLALSQARVDAMFLYLVSKGIDPARLTATAHGEANPVADNSTPEGRAKNRRVEFTVNNLLG